ncbi:MAG: DUF2510 domain-containing protein [Actinomycetota bacterium]
MSDLPPPSGPPPAGPPAGWYPDPDRRPGGTGYRWWDGTRWTEARTEEPRPHGFGLTPVGEWSSTTLRLVAQRFGNLFPLLVLLVVPTALASGFSGWWLLNGVVFDTEAETFSEFYSNPDVPAIAYVASSVTTVVSLLAALAVLVCATRQIRAHLDEEPEPWSASMLHGLRRFPAALVANLGVVLLQIGVLLVALIVGAIFPPLLLLTLPVALFVMLLLTVRTVLIPTVAAVEESPTQPLRTSWNLTRGQSWAVVGRLALLLLFGLSISLMASVVSAIVLQIVGGAGTEPIEAGATEIRGVDLVGENPAVFAIRQLIGGLGNGVSLLLWAAGFALVHRDIRARLEAEVN